MSFRPVEAIGLQALAHSFGDNDILHLVQLHFIFHLQVDDHILLIELHLNMRAFEVVTGRDFLLSNIDGIVQCLQVNFANYIERRHNTTIYQAIQPVSEG